MSATENLNVAELTGVHPGYSVAMNHECEPGGTTARKQSASHLGEVDKALVDDTLALRDAGSQALPQLVRTHASNPRYHAAT